MPLDIAIDVSAVGKDKIVLSGRESKQTIDTALFLTGLRAACEEQDPYFSLDPDDGDRWNAQGKDALNVLWNRIKGDFQPKLVKGERAGSAIDIRTVSASRDYPDAWRKISSNYPNLRSKLVFHPQWLAETRFGEILYKADVLLKELSVGVSILTPGPLRAAAIKGYLAADAERAAKNLLTGSKDHDASREQWRGSRLWFEILASPPTSRAPAIATPVPGGDSRLRSILQTRGFIRAEGDSKLQPSKIVQDGAVVDLSSINPRMFVRIHDHSTRQDLSDNDPDLDGLANDVSTRFDHYANVYEELRTLRDLFRAYIVAVQIVRNNSLCSQVTDLPLLDSEKVLSPLPAHHPSEIFFSVATYKTVTHTTQQALSTAASSINGGVSISGKRFYDAAITEGETDLTRGMKKWLASDNSLHADDSDPSRRVVILALDGPFTSAKLASSSRFAPYPPMLERPNPRRGGDGIDIENEPPSSSLPPVDRTRINWVVLLLLLIAASMAYQRFKPKSRFNK